MARDTKRNREKTQRITFPDVVDLSRFSHLRVVFTNGKEEIFNLQFSREDGGSGQVAVNVIGATREVSAALTLFDLKV
jgi:hypothetical protein